MCRIAVMLALAAWVTGGDAQEQRPRYQERVEVARVIIDARVLDGHGRAITGLETDDFEVRIGGKPARVESALWVGGDDDAVPAGTGDGAPMAPLLETPPGRLLVFLFQKDLEPSRIVGLMQMLLQAQDFLDGLTPDDRVAILSFDSHLKVWLDFSNDHERLRRILQRGILFERPPPVQEAPSPSLLTRLTPDRGRRAFSIEEGLRLIGEALAPLPGAKSVVLFGHGFGRLGLGGVSLDNEYGSAADALIQARASVFSLDVTRADYHTLEAGLQAVAEHTGGFYARTHIFPERAMRELAGALAGYYALFVERPDTDSRREIEVRLTRRKGQVLAARRVL